MTATFAKKRVIIKKDTLYSRVRYLVVLFPWQLYSFITVLFGCMFTPAYHFVADDLPFTSPEVYIHGFVSGLVLTCLLDLFTGGPLHEFFFKENNAEVVWNIPFWQRFGKKKYKAEVKDLDSIVPIAEWCKENAKYYELIQHLAENKCFIVLYDGNDFLRLKLTHAENIRT